MTAPVKSLVVYEIAKGKKISVPIEKESVWLTQAQMSELFNKDLRTINEHIQNIFSEKELVKSSVIRKSRITAADGKSYKTNLYNLDVIISVGYRVKSLEGTQFRIWATKVLRDFILKGYAINQHRIKDVGMEELERAVNLIRQTIDSKVLLR